MPRNVQTANHQVLIAVEIGDERGAPRGPEAYAGEDAGVPVSSTD